MRNGSEHIVLHAGMIAVKATPAMAPSVDKRLWEMRDIVAMIEEWETSNDVRGEG